jgi:transcription-repair coupling factor (superfamily II helicase)
MSTPLIHQLAARLFAAKTLEGLAAKLETGRDATVAVPLTARPLLVAAAFAARPRTTLVIVSGEDAAYLFSRDLAIWLGNDSVLHLPLRTHRPWSDAARDTEDTQQVGQRARALWALTSSQPLVVVASARALLRRIPPPASKVFAPLVFTAGQNLSQANASATCERAARLADNSPESGTPVTYDTLAQTLVEHGYERTEQAEQPGSFGLHGDVLDIYPAGASYPVRIEFFGDEVELIRRIVPMTGQTIGMLESVEVFPAREIALNKGTTQRALRELQALTGNSVHKLPKDFAQHSELLKAGIFFNAVESYLSWLYNNPATPLEWLTPKALVVPIEPRSLFDDTSRYFEEIEASAKASKVKSTDLYAAPAELDFGEQQRLTLLSLISGGASIDARIEVKHPDPFTTDEHLATVAQNLLAGGYATYLGIGDRRAREAIELAMSDAHVVFDEEAGGPADPATDPVADPAVLHISDADIPTSLLLPAAKLALLSLSPDASRNAARRGRRGGVGRGRIVDPTSLTFPFKPGDYVVHATHGIALFKHIVRREVGGVERDYLHLEYAHGDKLFTPVEQIDRVTRYVGPESATPRLTRLNTTDWSRALGKARKAARRLAFDLVDLYARRSTAKGYAYAPDNDQQYQMELAFPYEETPDQLAAIADVKADMESPRPMDRLICGDVGFGKTEVALRAAFKAVQSGKQVMFLCPTTILAQQHYTTFFERFDAFAVTVEVISRFRTTAQQKQILADFAAGTLDVLVGTHRLLSSDVNPRDLGLIVIDEEQRFGVQHKEQLKNLREQVDVLTLSATPIPRTMQMALSGVRDMSLIETPPTSRTPIKVHVGEWDEDVVSAAIRHEMARHGQVYYVSNRVKSIDDAVARVTVSAPEARIGVAHGQMQGKQLEEVMERFAANEYDVLVATTIIESGLDNPHTNTLIIEDSQRLGLAQLYQLKGRVGRAHSQAFAYFLFPSQAALTEEAIDRLTAIDEFQELGSGMKIAMRDLEIRGAGSLLGAEQHGMLSAVGFDLFASMLNEAVLAARASELAADEPVTASASGAKQTLDRSKAGSGHATTTPETTAADIRIDLPVPFFLPEEYVPAADERVLYYRRLAAAPGIDAVARTEDQLLHTYGALPAPAQNLVDRAKARNLAAELGIATIIQQRGKLVLEPVELNAEQAAAAKQAGGLYFPKTQKLQATPQPGLPLMQALLVLLQQLME